MGGAAARRRAALISGLALSLLAGCGGGGAGDGEPQVAGETVTSAAESTTTTTTAPATTSSTNAVGRGRVNRLEPPSGDPNAPAPGLRTTLDAYYELKFEGLGLNIAATSAANQPSCAVTKFTGSEEVGVNYGFRSNEFILGQDPVVPYVTVTIQRLPSKGSIISVSLFNTPGQPFKTDASFDWAEGQLGSGPATVFLDGSGAVFDVGLQEIFGERRTARLTGHITCVHDE